MALLYSARFRRCTVDRPGLGCASASRSIVDWRWAANPSAIRTSGRLRTVVGGISPERSLRATFSHTSAWEATSARSMCSRVSPPVFRRSLWHATQYVATNVEYSGASGGCVTARGADAKGAELITTRNTKLASETKPKELRAVVFAFLAAVIAF